jgi:hypothetical protein
VQGAGAVRFPRLDQTDVSVCVKYVLFYFCFRYLAMLKTESCT